MATVDHSWTPCPFALDLVYTDCICCLKHTVQYCTSRKTPAYTWFLDLPKAFGIEFYRLFMTLCGEVLRCHVAKWVHWTLEIVIIIIVISSNVAYLKRDVVINLSPVGYCKNIRIHWKSHEQNVVKKADSLLEPYRLWGETEE